jgi:arylsulfatase A-like enzyme
VTDLDRRQVVRRLASLVTAAFAVPGTACAQGGPSVRSLRELQRGTRTSGGTRRPNIVFVLMDDMRWDLMACAGHRFLRTSNLDRIAREGARFANAFVCLSLCSPSRASFLTGLYSHVHGVLDNRTPLDYSRLTTLPQILQNAGYRTAMVGKWHMGVDAEPKPGFDYWACFKGQGTYFDPELNVNGKMRPFTGFTDDVTTGLTADWITSQPGRPFAAILGFKSCHSPFEPPPRTSRLYANIAIPKPPTFDKAAPDQPAWIQQFDDTGHTPYSRIPYDELMLRFWRLVTAADENIGRLFARLQAIGRLDDTVLIFSSDNGFLLHEHGLYDKRAMYEESIRVPLLVRYPRLFRRARVIDEMALNIDVAPTLLDLVGAGGADRMQGRSLLGALAGKHGPRRSIFFYQYDREQPYSTPSLMGVRTHDWKLVRYLEEGQAHELYHLAKDPHETTNLFRSQAHQGHRRRLEKELDRLAPLAKIPRPI